VVNTDDVTGLKLVREAGSKCFNGQRDSNLTGRDAVEATSDETGTELILLVRI